MPRLTRQVPRYRLHRASSQAIVSLDGRRIYLGKHGSAASTAEYERIIREWLAHQRRLPGRAGLSVNELILAYWRFAESHYSRDGKPTRHLENIRNALKSLRQLYGHTPAEEFGAAAAKTIRRAMIDSGLCRNTVNGRMGKIRSMLKWAVGEKLIPADVLAEVKTVKALELGRQGVRETEEVRPVPDEHVRAVLPYLPAPVRAMVQVQWLTGMRPAEVASMKAGEIDRTGAVWAYRPARHKTMHKGIDRVVMIGPKAQEVLAPWLTDDPSAYLFSPRAAVEARNAERRASRRTPLTPSQAARKRKKNPRRKPGAFYTKNAYSEAVVRACSKAGVPAWRPNRLRHALATKVAKEYDLRAAQLILGHKSIRTTEVYVKPEPELSRDVMARIG
jgi:integrase